MSSPRRYATWLAWIAVTVVSHCLHFDATPQNLSHMAKSARVAWRQAVPDRRYKKREVSSVWRKSVQETRCCHHRSLHTVAMDMFT
jgi:hypothetical protein